MEILALIPARSGSKGVPGKNIRLLAGKPVIAWTIETALSTTALNRVVVSTDSPEIAEIAREYGAEAPFLRPLEHAQDDTLDLPVMQHALRWLAEHEGYLPDIVVWLRPTAPLRTPDDIDQAVARLLETEADWVRSVCPVEHHPYWMQNLEGGMLVQFMPEIDIREYYMRQLLPPAYRLNGAIEVTRRTTITEKGLLYSGELAGYVMPTARSIDLDTEMDFILLELILTGKVTV